MNTTATNKKHSNKRNESNGKRVITSEKLKLFEIVAHGDAEALEYINALVRQVRLS